MTAPLLDGRYRLERVLGRGGMGLVHLAYDVGLERHVAVKMLMPTPTPQSALFERFAKEARALATVRSDHVARAYSFGSTPEGALFLVMEHVDGIELEDVIMQHASRSMHVPLASSLQIMREIAVGLSAVHERGLVHRDVKPSNVVIERGTGRAVLLDFGLARRMNDANRNMTLVSGTPLFMAPEQASDTMLVDAAGITARTDIYALGCTLFYLLTGNPPFIADDYYTLANMHKNQAPPSLAHARRDAAFLEQVFMKAVAKDPMNRFESCRAFIAALDAAQAQAGKSVALRPHPIDELRVLLVEDDPDFAMFMRAALRLALGTTRPTSVLVASSGEDAVNMFMREKPHCILIDYELPGMTGVEALSMIRALPGGQEVRVAGTSAHLDRDIPTRFLMLGATRFLAKPLGLRALVEFLKDFTQDASTVQAEVA